MRQIVDVIDEAKDVYIDTTLKDNAIIYIFTDSINQDKLNKIVVKPNKTIKKFGISNALVTLGKINKKDLIKDENSGLWIKVEQ